MSTLEEFHYCPRCKEYKSILYDFKDNEVIVSSTTCNCVSVKDRTNDKRIKNKNKKILDIAFKQLEKLK
jgi:hypothetical protein